MRKRTIQYCIKHALKKLEHHPADKFLHYSFIIVNDSIISVGVNFKDSTNVPKGFGYHDLGYVYNGKVTGPTTHSEVNAYNKAKSDIKPNEPFEVLNLRFNQYGELRMSQPCKCCNNFLKALGCKCVYFSTDGGIARLKY
jgi:hypothetical protein